MDPAPATAQRSALIRDAARLQESVADLIRVLHFRDRDRACCYDLSVSQCHALEVLVKHGPMSVTRLGDFLYLEKSTASRLAKALLEKELVRRRAPKNDGRVVILQVTEAGQRLARKILNDLAEEYRELLGEFDADVRAALPRLLHRLTQTYVRRMDPSGASCCQRNS